MGMENKCDSLAPAEIAKKLEENGIRKVETTTGKVFLLAIMAGGFVAMGAVFYTTVLAGSSALPYGVARLLGGLAFCLGLILVVVAGAELFTGNSLMVLALASRRVSFVEFLRNWGIVYMGNLVGSLGLVVLMVLSRQYTDGAGMVGETALVIASGKVQLDFIQAIALGILCNILVCLAIWMTFASRNLSGKIMAIIFPITAFAAAGFEHSVANMYFIPFGLLIKRFDPVFVASLGDKINLAGLTWGSFFLKNLLPVTIGNIIGGGGVVGLMYWVIYLREPK